MSRPISTESKFRALAHATRRRVLELLIRRTHTAGELAQHFNHSRPVLSKHLRVLQAVGFIAFKRQGASLVYHLVPSAFDSVRAWIGRVPLAK
jgi:DNA-binding transcriptional ArsR family regulator